MLLIYLLFASFQITITFGSGSNDDATPTPLPAIVKLNHSYYHMQLFLNNADSMYNEHHVDMSDADIHPILSNTTRAAVKIHPKFQFPFYGHDMTQFYATNHGFLSFSDQLHNLIFRTQYIAPLRVKFDASASDHATVRYLSNGNRLTVEWNNLTVTEKFAHPEGGTFTFQASLYPNGVIVFVYVSVPAVLTLDALYEREPVSGISDAFLLNDNELHVYDTIFVHNVDIVNRTVVVFKPNPTCNRQQTCDSCLSLTENSNFSCEWCHYPVNRCSDGLDRLRQNWNENECHKRDDTQTCDLDTKSRVPKSRIFPPPYSDKSMDSGSGDAITIAVSIISIFMLIGMLLIFLRLYGKRNPGSVVGLMQGKLVLKYQQHTNDGRERLRNEHVDQEKTDSMRDGVTVISTQPIPDVVDTTDDFKSQKTEKEMGVGSIAMKMKEWKQFETEAEKDNPRHH